MRGILKLAALVLLLVPPAASGQTTAGAPRPNVLFIAVDDLNTDVGTYGRTMVQTPNLDRLAARGRRFDRAYAQYPLCNPSRTSVLSGRLPEDTGVTTNNTDPRVAMPGADFLPQHFREHGYHTAYVGKIFHKGFEDEKYSWSEALTVPDNVVDDERGVTEDSTGRNATDYPDWIHFDGAAARSAADYLARPHATPFFLAVGFHKPHMPSVCPKTYWDLYDIARIRLPQVPSGGLENTPEEALHASMNVPPSTNIDRRESILAYRACTSFMDAQLGVVLDALDATGLRDNTIVVLWSDHGYHLDDHRHLWGKGTLFDRATRVPLVVAGPPVRAKGTATGSLVELMDIYPTLTELCGLPTPPKCQGKSLAPILKDPAASVNDYAYTVARGGDARCVNTKRWRYTEWGGPKVAELYNLEKDPGEYYNLANDPKLASVVATMQATLKRAGAR